MQRRRARAARVAPTHLEHLPEPVLVGTTVRITRGEEVVETVLAPGLAEYMRARHPEAVEILDEPTDES